MGYAGNNLKTVKASNRSTILKLLNDQGAMSRKDIAQALHLTPATVTMICTEMLSAGILRELGVEAGQQHVGRKKVLIDINYQWRYVLSINIEQPETCITVSDLQGHPVAARRLRTDARQEPEYFLKRVADQGKSLLLENGIGRTSVLGAGVSIPGPVYRKIGVSQYAYRIWNKPVLVGEILKQYLDFPVVVENNIKAFSEAELIYGRGRERENLLFVKWGPGVGSAIIIQRGVYDSQNSQAAEIGHCVVEKNGRPCRCGRRGCLETYVSSYAIVGELQSRCTAGSMPRLYQLIEGDVSRITVDNLFQWFNLDDPGLWETMDEIIDLLARTISNAITLLAPDEVIAYGSMFDQTRIWEHFLDACAQYDPTHHVDYIKKSQLCGQISYIGPLAIAVNELFLMPGTTDAT